MAGACCKAPRTVSARVASRRKRDSPQSLAMLVRCGADRSGRQMEMERPSAFSICHTDQRLALCNPTTDRTPFRTQPDECARHATSCCLQHSAGNRCCSLLEQVRGVAFCLYDLDPWMQHPVMVFPCATWLPHRWTYLRLRVTSRHFSIEPRPTNFRGNS